MTEFERELLALGEHISFPATPAFSVPRARSRAGRGLLLASTLAFVLMATAFAVPQIRHAVLDIVGLRGASIERVKKLPEASPSCPLGGGGERVATLDEAASRSGIAPQLPPGKGNPDAIYLGPGRRGGGITLVYLAGGGFTVQAVLSEVDATLDPSVFKKVATGTRVEPLQILGHSAALFTGKRHVVSYVTRKGRYVSEHSCLTGTTLLLEHGNLLYRLETELPRKQLIAIARSFG